MIPDIAIGAIGAALIGATISLLSLIISKEAKVSEFRQAWIDGLRDELSTFMSSANTIADIKKLSFKDSEAKYDIAMPFNKELNKSYYSIALRLNTEEDICKKLRATMVESLKIMGKPGPFDISKFEQCRVEFIDYSNELLKGEWKRVKSGEVTFRIAKWSAAIIVAIILLLGSVYSFNSRSEVPLPSQDIDVRGHSVPASQGKQT